MRRNHTSHLHAYLNNRKQRYTGVGFPVCLKSHYSVYWGLQVHQPQFFGTKPKSLQRYIYKFQYFAI